MQMPCSHRQLAWATCGAIRLFPRRKSKNNDHEMAKDPVIWAEDKEILALEGNDGLAKLTPRSRISRAANIDKKTFLNN